MKYVLIENGTVIHVMRVVPSTVIAPEHAALYIECPDDNVQVGWTWDGVNFAEPEPVAPVAAIPQEVTMRQARLALHGAGLLANVDAAVASMEGAQGDVARIEWEYSNTVRRNQPLIMALAPGLGLTSDQIDTLFITAATL